MLKKLTINKYNETIYYDKLDNGLEVFMWPQTNVSNFYATLSVKYGSIDTEFKIGNETQKVSKGIAHFLEHVKFNEGPNKTAHDYYNKLGSSINAFTTFDYTAYEVLASANLKENITHLLDYVETPYFTKELIEKERKIILNEVKMGKNNPYQVLYYHLNNALFHNNQRKYYVTGDEEDVKNITLEEINLVYNTFYHPSNMFLTVTGNFDPDYLDVIIRENQNSKEFPKYLNPLKIKPKEKETVNEERVTVNGNVTTPKLRIAYKIKKSSLGNISDMEKLVYTRIILNANFGTTSDIKERLLESNLISKLSTNAYLVDDFLIININAETKYPNEIEKRLKENYDHMDLTPKRLERRIRCNIADFIYGLDDIEYLNNMIQDNIMTHNKFIINTYDVVKNLNMNTASKVIEDLKAYSVCTVIMNPLEEQPHE